MMQYRDAWHFGTTSGGNFRWWGGGYQLWGTWVGPWPGLSKNFESNLNQNHLAASYRFKFYNLKIYLERFNTQILWLTNKHGCLCFLIILSTPRFPGPFLRCRETTKAQTRPHQRLTARDQHVEHPQATRKGPWWIGYLHHVFFGTSRNFFVNFWLKPKFPNPSTNWYTKPSVSCLNFPNFHHLNTYPSSHKHGSVYNGPLQD